jgi:hypothetical protein
LEFGVDLPDDEALAKMFETSLDAVELSAGGR